MNAPAEITPEAIEEAEAAEKQLAEAQSFTVATAEDYSNAADYVKQLTGQRNKIEEMRTTMKAPALETCRRIDAFFKTPKERLERAISAVKAVMVTYNDEQERIRQEEQRKAAEAARKERERLAQEAAKKEEAARKKREAEEEKARKLEEAGRLAEAEAKREAAEAAEVAKVREAELAREAADQIPDAPVVHHEQPKTAGVHTTKTWTFEIVDESKVPDEYKIIDEKAIRGVVKATKGKMQIPGIRIFQKSNIASQGA